MAALSRAERAEARLAALIGELAERGLVAEEDVPEMTPELWGSPLQQYQPEIIVSAAAAPDKHTVANADIDCQSLLHLCHARCCRYRVQLSYQDVEDGLRWVYERPYELRREADGYCTYFDRGESPGCSTYQTRPAPCRTFDCKTNPNVWLDFENKIPVPMTPPLFQIRRK
jgi:Putative zinc- or iron-chelating domain